jgi:high-affinity iron transporter
MRKWIVLAAVLGSVLSLGAAPAKTPALIAQGKQIYEGSAAGCFACHGLTGEGNGPVAFALNPKPRNFQKDPFKGGESVEQVFATISNGLKGTQMVAYDKLPESDRWALAYYVLAFKK